LGGPVAQIALIKERLVTEEKWITLARFHLRARSC
jgi:chromate transport protein ChrA